MKPTRKDILTIPNLLSLLRLLMIPLFAWLYLQGRVRETAVVLILSGVTDVVDGWIARRFNQVSDFGKAFDPIADKLTQAVMLFCLVKTHPMMLISLVLLVIKEVFCGLSALVVIKKTGIVPMAQWHGKLTTMLLYGMMILHLIWQEIPLWASNTMNVGCVVMLAVSMFLYGRSYIRAIRKAE